MLGAGIKPKTGNHNMNIFRKLLPILSIFSLAADGASESRSLRPLKSCPPEGFDSRSEIDLDSFISARWYSIKQKEVRYQPLDQFYCVYAEYERDTSFCLTCLGRPKIKVFNRALRGSVTGAERSVDFRAVFPFPDKHPARALVGPRFLPLSLIPTTNYWVVAAGLYADVVAGNDSTGTQYEWAIITTGTPKTEGTNGKCYTNSGMWIFARDPEPSTEIVAAIERKAEELGLDTSIWQPVAHAGCNYDVASA